MKSIVTMAKEVSKANVKVVVLNDGTTEALKNFVLSFNRKDANTKELFIVLLKLYRTHKEDKNSLVLSLGNAFNIISQGNNEIIKKLKLVSRMASEANDVKLVIKLEDAYYYNIEASIKLMTVLNEEQQKDIRKELMACYSKDLTMVAYNNVVSSKIKELRKKFNIIDVDGVTIISTLKQKINKLSNDEKRELLTYLQTCVK